VPYGLSGYTNLGETRYLRLQSFHLTETIAFWVAKQPGYCGWYGDG
jgi:hypothetical protein